MDSVIYIFIHFITILLTVIKMVIMFLNIFFKFSPSATEGWCSTAGIKTGTHGYTRSRCRGFLAQSVWKFLTAVGLMGTERKKAVQRLGEASERDSCWIWRREEQSRKSGGSEYWLSS